MNTVLRRAGITAATAGIVLAIWAAPAAAHVTVTPREATQGGYTKLTFRVPNEKDNASTTKLEVALPTDAPFASVSVKPAAGWKIVVTKSKLDKPVKAHDEEITEAVSRITWIADSANTAVKPGQFAEFDISVGPLPEKDSLVFKALQTYSDGDVVRWIDEASGSSEPEHPAPVLKLTKASATGHTEPTTAAAAADTDLAEDTGNGLAVGLGIAGTRARRPRPGPDRRPTT